MSHVATAFLQAELQDDCDEMELEDQRERKALGAFAFLFAPEDTMVECGGCKTPVALDIAIPSPKVCEFLCGNCDAKRVAERNLVIFPDQLTEEFIIRNQEHRDKQRDLCLTDVESA